MPYEDHPAFEKPADPATTLWRYSDFTKFVSLIHRRALYFSRADLLGDRFEGSMSRANLRLRPEVYRHMDEGFRQRLFEQIAKGTRAYLARTFVNSWTMADYESVALWRMYVGQTNGIAIRSTFERLRASLDASYPESIHVGMVKYLNWDSDWTPEGNTLYPFVHKRRSFDFEHEVRGVIQPMDVKDDKVDLSPRPEPGLYVPVDLDQLLVEVRLDPVSGPWFAELVASVLNHYRVNIPVRQSDLAGEPTF
jgi:hypothetical protein